MGTISCSDEDYQKYIQDNQIVLLRFYSDWCGTCRLFHSLFVSLSEEDRFRDVLFLEINLDNNAKAKEDFNVNTVPSYALLREGKLIEFVSPSSEDQIDSLINKLENHISIW